MKEITLTVKADLPITAAESLESQLRCAVREVLGEWFTKGHLSAPLVESTLYDDHEDFA